MENGIVIIDVINAVNEGETDVLNADLYIKSINKGKVKVDYIESINGTDLGELIKLSETKLITELGGVKEDDEGKSIKPEVTTTLSSALTGMVVNNEVATFKNKLANDINGLKFSMTSTQNIMIDLTDEQKSYIRAFEKAAQVITENFLL